VAAPILIPAGLWRRELDSARAACS